ncbi:MAG: InlB B-repeat-containing protein [Firmicutes bacterium]|nr:InlB B-repeat-containing protein [Bacillota bacterium]
MRKFFGRKLFVAAVVLLMAATPALFLTACGGSNNNNDEDETPPAPTVTLNPTSVSINDTTPTATIAVGGTATGAVTLNTSQLPSAVDATVDGTTITVTGTRPSTNVAAVTGSPVIVVTREGVSQNLTVNINLTTTYTPDTGGTPPPPVPEISITTQPTGATLTYGFVAGELTVVATVTLGATLTYQWLQRDGENWVNVGTNNPSFAIPTALGVGRHEFRVRVSTSNGEVNVLSSIVEVVVNAPETEPGQPTRTVTINITGTGAEGVTHSAPETILQTATELEFILGDVAGDATINLPQGATRAGMVVTVVITPGSSAIVVNIEIVAFDPGPPPLALSDFVTVVETFLDDGIGNFRIVVTEALFGMGGEPLGEIEINIFEVLNNVIRQDQFITEDTYPFAVLEHQFGYLVTEDGLDGPTTRVFFLVEDEWFYWWTDNDVIFYTQVLLGLADLVELCTETSTAYQTVYMFDEESFFGEEFISIVVTALGLTVIIDFGADGQTTFEFTIGGVVIETDIDEIIREATFIGGGGEPGPQMFSITVDDDIVGGQVYTDFSSAHEGQRVEMWFTFDGRYTFVHFTVNGDPTTDNWFYMPAMDVTVSAVFAPHPTFNITIAPMVGGTVTASHTSAQEWEWIELTVVADTGFRLAAGSLHVNGEYIGMWFSMPDQDVTITATFEPLPVDTFNIFINITGDGFIHGPMQYAAVGDWVDVWISAGSGYRFVEGSLMKNGEPWNSGFYMPAYHVTLTAVFEPMPTITIETENGWIDTMQHAEAGETVHFLINPFQGFIFVEGSIAINGVPLPVGQLYFVMPNMNVIITATFEPIPTGTFSIMVSQGWQGHITASHAYAAPGTTITVTVEAFGVWVLSQIFVGGEPIVGTTFIMPNGPIEIWATFEAPPRTERDIFIASLENGDISPNIWEANPGTTVILTIHASFGFRLVPGSIRVNGNPIVGLSFIMPNEDVTITAQFEPLPPQVHVSFVTGTEQVIEFITVFYQESYGALPSAVRDGFFFVGWFTAPDGGTQVMAGTTVTNMMEHNLYARWEAQRPIVEVTDVRQNGVFGEVTTTQITIEFCSDPIGLELGHFTIWGATGVELTGDGNIRILHITDVTLFNNQIIRIFIASPPGSSLLGGMIDLALYVELDDAIIASRELIVALEMSPDLADVLPDSLLGIDGHTMPLAAGGIMPLNSGWGQRDNLVNHMRNFADGFASHYEHFQRGAESNRTFFERALYSDNFVEMNAWFVYSDMFWRVNIYDDMTTIEATSLGGAIDFQVMLVIYNEYTFQLLMLENARRSIINRDRYSFFTVGGGGIIVNNEGTDNEWHFNDLQGFEFNELEDGTRQIIHMNQRNYHYVGSLGQDSPWLGSYSLGFFECDGVTSQLYSRGLSSFINANDSPFAQDTETSTLSVLRGDEFNHLRYWSRYRADLGFAETWEANGLTVWNMDNINNMFEFDAGFDMVDHFQELQQGRGASFTVDGMMFDEPITKSIEFNTNLVEFVAQIVEEEVGFAAGRQWRRNIDTVTSNIRTENANFTMTVDSGTLCHNQRLWTSTVRIDGNRAHVHSVGVVTSENTWPQDDVIEERYYELVDGQLYSFEYNEETGTFIGRPTNMLVHHAYPPTLARHVTWDNTAVPGFSLGHVLGSIRNGFVAVEYLGAGDFRLALSDFDPNGADSYFTITDGYLTHFDGPLAQMTIEYGNTTIDFGNHIFATRLDTPTIVSADNGLLVWEDVEDAARYSVQGHVVWDTGHTSEINFGWEGSSIEDTQFDLMNFWSHGFPFSVNVLRINIAVVAHPGYWSPHLMQSLSTEYLFLTLYREDADFDNWVTENMQSYLFWNESANFRATRVETYGGVETTTIFQTIDNVGVDFDVDGDGTKTTTQIRYVLPGGVAVYSLQPDDQGRWVQERTGFNLSPASAWGSENHIQNLNWHVNDQGYVFPTRDGVVEVTNLNYGRERVRITVENSRIVEFALYFDDGRNVVITIEYGVVEYLYIPSLPVEVTLESGTGESVPSLNTYFGVPYGDLPTLARDGHIFMGWYTRSIGGVRVDATDTIAIMTDHTLYARWQVVIEVTVRFNTGTDEFFDARTLRMGDTYGDLPVPADRHGWIFHGWYLNHIGGFIAAAGMEVAFDFNHTLYARWTRVAIDITLVNGEESDVITRGFGTMVGELPMPTREGYIFRGWFTAETGGVLVAPDTIVEDFGGYTFFARWEEMPSMDAMIEFVRNAVENLSIGLAHEFVSPEQFASFRDLNFWGIDQSIRSQLFWFVGEVVSLSWFVDSWRFEVLRAVTSDYLVLVGEPFEFGGRTWIVTIDGTVVSVAAFTDDGFEMRLTIQDDQTFVFAMIDGARYTYASGCADTFVFYQSFPSMGNRIEFMFVFAWGEDVIEFSYHHHMIMAGGSMQTSITHFEITNYQILWFDTMYGESYLPEQSPYAYYSINTSLTVVQGFMNGVVTSRFFEHDGMTSEWSNMFLHFYPGFDVAARHDLFVTHFETFVLDGIDMPIGMDWGFSPAMHTHITNLVVR